MNVKGVKIERYNGYFYKHFNNSLWLLLVRQNSEDCIPFKNKDVAKYSPNDMKRYSILTLLNDKFKINNEYFEFILEYIVNDTSKINWWIQNDNPFDIQPNYDIDENDEKYEELKVPGFKKIQTYYDMNHWKGLALTDENATVLDGAPFSTTYYFAVGMTEYLSCFIPTNVNHGSNESLFGVRLPSLTSIFPKIQTKMDPYLIFNGVLFTVLMNSQNS